MADPVREEMVQKMEEFNKRLARGISWNSPAEILITDLLRVIKGHTYQHGRGEYLTLFRSCDADLRSTLESLPEEVKR